MRRTIHHPLQVRPEEVELIRRDYTANGGWETFLEYGDPRQDILVGLLRLRRCAGADAERQPALRGAVSVVRELHVYGSAVAVHARDASKFQHQVRVCWAGGGCWACLLCRPPCPAVRPALALRRRHHMPWLTAHPAPRHPPSHHLPTLHPPSPARPQGYGTLLMLEAERIARHEHRSAKLAVISGVGTRHYYRKLGCGQEREVAGGQLEGHGGRGWGVEQWEDGGRAEATGRGGRAQPCARARKHSRARTGVCLPAATRAARGPRLARVSAWLL